MEFSHCYNAYFRFSHCYNAYFHWRVETHQRKVQGFWRK